jgi:predicted RNA-binding protein with TRAM domain
MTAAGETIAITGIAGGGDGVGRLADGRAIFVPRTAPGDRVALDPGRIERRRSYARGRVAAVLAPGPDRVVPACPHYEGDRCGGCQLQHLAYPAQLAAKRRIVGDTLRAQPPWACDDRIEPPRRGGTGPRSLGRPARHGFTATTALSVFRWSIARRRALMRCGRQAGTAAAPPSVDPAPRPRGGGT